MFSWCKFVIVWLLALALPAQGLAAVSLAHCAPSHERMHVAALAAEHRQAADDAALGNDRHAGFEVEAADLTVPPDPMTDLGGYQCSACGSCCSAHAPADAMPRLPLLPSAPTRFAEAAVAVDPFAAAGPERPPRTVLA